MVQIMQFLVALLLAFAPAASGFTTPLVGRVPPVRAGAATAAGSVEAPMTVAAASPSNPEHDILLRAARGEKTERSPVWLMRQAGRYMADFRAYSDKYPFRYRSETPEIATELSLQCWKKFGLDAVIFFSDILTPLPAVGVEFDVIKGKGPVIAEPLRGRARVEAVVEKCLQFDPATQLPFTGATLSALRKETEGKTTLVGFVGAPWTLAAYAAEGGSTKHALHIKAMMRDDPELAHLLFSHLADMLGQYACYQVESGAQMIQVFESWAHQMNPADFETFAKPYAARVASWVKAAHPDVPVLFFANGGSGYLETQRSLIRGAPGAAAASGAGAAGLFDAVSLDWSCTMSGAREVFGDDVVLQGNVDPTILLGPDAGIDAAVAECIASAGGPGNRHILNLGHGVLQPTPEEAVARFVDAAKAIRAD